MVEPVAGRSRSRWLRRATVALLVATCAYALLLGAVAVGYRWFLYPGRHHDAAPSAPGATLVRIDGDGGPSVFALHVPAPPSAPTLVLFHGNGEDLVDEAKNVRAFADLGVGVFAVEYPGYGLAHGERATEASIYRAAELAIAHLDAEGVDRSKRVLVGFSLGSGVAVEMAHRGLGARLVVLAAFTSIPKLVGRFVPVVPATWLVGDAFDSLSKAPHVHVPALVVHGDLDRVVPLVMGERLAAAFPRATLHVVRGARHNDLYAIAPELMAGIVAFARGETF